MKKPVVLTTIAPYAGFLEELGGGHFEVITLIPSNFDPHLFEPTPHDLIKVGDTTLWVRCGEPIEEKFNKVLPQRTARMDLPSSQNRAHAACSHHDHNHNHTHNDHAHCTSHTDPHYWTSPTMLEKDIVAMAETLALCFPEKEEAILKKAEEIQKRLQVLDLAIRNTLEHKNNCAILVSHPSFGPFCDAYGIEQISLEAEGKELSARDIMERKEQVANQQKLLVVGQPQHPFQNLSHFAIREGSYYEVDPYAENIEATLLHLAEHIANEPTPQ